MRQWNVEHRNVEQKCCCVQVEKLTKAEFSEALFQLVDVWCEHVEAMELFAEFLKTVFQSITSFDRQGKCHRKKNAGSCRKEQMDTQYREKASEGTLVPELSDTFSPAFHGVNLACSQLWAAASRTEPGRSHVASKSPLGPYIL